MSSDIVADSSVIPPVPSTSPTGTPTWAKLPSRPRLLLVTPFHREQHRAAPLAADRDALQHAQRHEQQRRRDADGCGPGQDADDGRSDAHHQQRDDQRGLAADPVAPVPEDGRPDRPCGEPHEIGRERLHRAGVRAGCGKEQVRERPARRRCCRGRSRTTRSSCRSRSPSRHAVPVPVAIPGQLAPR